jgi:hypothetical protein
MCVTRIMAGTEGFLSLSFWRLWRDRRLYLPLLAVIFRCGSIVFALVVIEKPAFFAFVREQGVQVIFEDSVLVDAQRDNRRL